MSVSVIIIITIVVVVTELVTLALLCDPLVFAGTFL